MATSTIPSRLAYFQETTSGTGPADWAASGVQIRHMAESLDTSSLQQTVLEDERSQLSVLAYEKHIKGIKGGVSFDHEMYFHGIGTATAGGEQAAATPLSNLLGHCQGGQWRGRSTTADGTHSGTTVELADATGFAVGGFLAWVNPAGLAEIRQITDLTGSVATVHRAFSGTPSNADVITACIVIYEDEDVLIDSNVGPTTLSWLLGKGKGSATEYHECRGCKSNISGFSFGRNTVAKVSLSTLVASFSDPDESPSPSWSSLPSGHAGRAIGPSTTVFVQDYASTADNRVGCSEFSVTPGISPSLAETLTENAAGMPGLYGYGLERNPCTVQMTVVPSATSWHEDFTDGNLKHVQFEKLAPPGSAWSLYFPRCEVGTQPSRGATGVTMASSFTVNALQDEGANALQTSRMYIVLA
jgi:hypothetical protein